MGKKFIAILLILVNVFALASCMKPKETDPSETETDESDVSTTESRVYEAVERIAASLAECNYENFRKNSTKDSKEVEKAMPAVPEIADDDYKTPRPDKALVVKNMVISSLTYEIDEKSFKSGLWGSDCSVDVKFSYKDYNEVVGKRDIFLGPADFNTLLADVEKTIDTKINLIFTKVGDDYQLYNPAEFICLYNYENLETLKFMKNCFDMVKNVYMTGPGWDEATESYTDVNEFTIVFELDERAKNYVWTYIYRVSEELNPKWNHLYTSSRITVESPTEIRITYKQDEIFKTGYYCFIIYDPQSETLMGMEYDVYNTKDGSMPTTTESTTETTT